jgi:UDP-N-acetyl-D-glucosamine dehydrogenase
MEAFQAMSIASSPRSLTGTQLEVAIRNKTAVVGVVGLGYVGLPLVQAFIKAGFHTMGFDIDQAKVDLLLAGKTYISHVKPEWIRDCLKDRTFTPTADMSRLSEADALLICVPTPLNESRDPDLQFIEATGRQIAAVLRPGQLVVLESTTYPGTTRDVLLPILQASGLREGEDFYLAYSPEREDPGNPNFTAARIPKVVGGMDESSLGLAQLLYSAAIVETVPVPTVEVAEAVRSWKTPTGP